jgi:DNA-binding NarL/FixJ family response regulator
MQQAQIITYGVEERLVALLQELAQSRSIWVRTVQQERACRKLLRTGGAAVLIVALGRDLIRELTLLLDVTTECPQTAVVVVGDTDHPALAALAWDLGARCVLQPPLPIELLPETVLRLLAVSES